MTEPPALPPPTTSTRDALVAALGLLLGGGGLAALLRAFRRPPAPPPKRDAALDRLERALDDVVRRVERLERTQDERYVTGTGMRAVLPSSPGPGLGWSAPPAPAPAPLGDDGAEPRGILVVEDDRSYARAEVRLLDSLGEPVFAAHTAEEARALLADRVFVVAVIDLGFPGLSARQIVGDLLDRRTRVVLCSGRTAEEIEAMRAELGADRGVAKVDGGRALVQAVQSLLPQRRREEGGE
jgi:CheY-like chemotaxis protein